MSAIERAYEAQSNSATNAIKNGLITENYLTAKLYSTQLRSIYWQKFKPGKEIEDREEEKGACEALPDKERGCGVRGCESAVIVRLLLVQEKDEATVHAT